MPKTEVLPDKRLGLGINRKILNPERNRLKPTAVLNQTRIARMGRPIKGGSTTLFRSYLLD